MLLICFMALNTQGHFAVEPGMVWVITTLGGMTAYTGHHLSGSRVEDIFTNGVGEYAVLPMALTADVINLVLEHGRVVGTVRCVAVVTGISFLVTEFCLIPPLECGLMAFAANVAFLALEQSGVIAGMGRMTGHAGIIFISYKVVMR